MSGIGYLLWDQAVENMPAIGLANSPSVDQIHTSVPEMLELLKLAQIMMFHQMTQKPF